MIANILTILAAILGGLQYVFSTKQAAKDREAAEIGREAQRQIDKDTTTDAANTSADLERLHSADSLRDQRAAVQDAIDRANG